MIRGDEETSDEAIPSSQMKETGVEIFGTIAESGSFAGVKSAVSAGAKKGLPRAFDVIVSLISLAVAAPLLFVAGITIFLTSRGGVLFKQRRVGRNGALFLLYKLRTMNPSNAGTQITSSDDTRITQVGRFLRRTKLDELPTLWNVLKGDMGLVGPRPEVPRYVSAGDPIWQRVLAVRPGITDPVTLQLRNEEQLLARVDGDPEKYYVETLQPLKLKGYLAYLDKRSWQSDLGILWRTVVAIVSG